MKPNTKLPGSAKPARGVDLLSPKTWLVVGPALALAVGVARMHRGIVTPVAFVLLVRYAAVLGDAWEGQRRQRAGLKATLLAFLGLGMWWPAPWPGWWLIAWIATPILLAIYATRAIGSSNSPARVQAKIAVGFAAASKHLPPGVTQRGPAVISGRTQRIKFTTEVGTPKWEPKNSALHIAQSADGMAASQVEIVPLHHDQAGLYELVVRTGKPFQLDADPTYPDPNDWKTTGRYPLGWNGDGEIVWVDMGSTAGKHYYAAGRTGSGKSNSLLVIATGLHHLGYEFWSIDPHEEFGEFPCRHHVTEVARGRALLADLIDEMADRLKNRGVTHTPIHCLIDEAPSVLSDKKAAAAAIRLGQEGRKVGIVLGTGVQNPKAEQFPIDLRSQMSVVLAHRLKDSTGTGVALGPGAVAEGWLAHKIRKQGRGILELEYGEPPRQYVQVFPAPDAPLQPEVIEARHWKPPTLILPPADAWPARPPSECTTQGVHGSAEVPTEPERNHTPEPDGTTKATIEAMLNGKPITGVDAAEKARCTPENARKHLRNLAKEGKARKDGRGYVRADNRC